MLTPQLKKLKQHLEGTRKKIDEELLLNELKKLDEEDMESLFESLSMSADVCPTCGREFKGELL